LVVLDVRTQSEYDSGHIRNAKLIPHTELEGRLDELNKTDGILVYCRTGGRSSTASQILVDNGFLYVYNMLGGITAWIDEGYPVYVKYSSIQEAINNASEGETIFVSSGLYYEHLTVNKSLALVGENKDTTIIDGTTTGTVVHVKAENISISSFTIRKSGCACSGYSGVYVESYHQNVNVTNNLIMQNGYGIKLDWAHNIIIARNNIINNDDGVHILNYSSNNSIVGNILTNNGVGIEFHKSSNNTLSGNNIKNNDFYGVWLDSSSYNKLYHNNFIDNTQQVYSYASTNVWDYGYPSGGNYWSDYTGADLYSGPNQNVTGSDGIGDTPYVTDENNTDNLPLMSPFEYWSNPISGDINKDMKVNWKDLLMLARAYGAEKGELSYLLGADLNDDDEIDWKDLLILAMNYGKEWEQT